jgi:hypothetical protein
MAALGRPLDTLAEQGQDLGTNLTGRWDPVGANVQYRQLGRDQGAVDELIA